MRVKTTISVCLALVATALLAAAPAWAAGPAMVKDINPGAGDSSPAALTNLSGTLFFAASDGAHGVELWKSDGTAAGTVMVKDINPGGDSNPESLVNVNGTLFFSADDGTHGRELWKSDGTAAGTVLVSDINPGSAPSNPFWLTDVGGELLFSADDGVHGDELWKSDGTAAGTALVKDIYPGSSSNPTDLVNVGGTVFFHATENVHGDELWKSDGTSAGTALVDDINPGTAGSNISEPTNVNGTLFFAAFDGTRYSLWKSDGTTAGTSAVKFVGSIPSNLTGVGGTLFFAANDTTHGLELWKSDGTDPGTVMVKDINPGPGSSNPGRLGAIDFNGTLFFGADDGTDGVELWKSDGTDAGTVMVKDINPGGDSSPGLFTSFGGQLYFVADDGSHGRELWSTDGTAAGTALVADINPGASDSFPASFAQVNGALFFSADDGTHGRELWTLTGTASPTSTRVSCAPGVVTVGQATSCTAKVLAAGNPPPSGTVSFTSDSSGSFDSGGACTLTPTGSAGESACHVNYTPTAVGTGTHTITASYNGDATHAASSGSGSVTVTGGGGGGGGQRATATSVSCAPGSVPVGIQSGCAATVIDIGSGSSVLPTGSVSFTTDSHGTFNTASCTLIRVNAATADCIAAYTPSAVDSGTHTITAAYGGDGSHGASSGRGTLAVSSATTPPQNTALPSIYPEPGCQYFNGRPVCQVIPYQYGCDPGQWVGNDPTVPYEYEWQQLYDHLLGNVPVPLGWQPEPHGNGQSFYAFNHPALNIPTGFFRCMVTATGPGGSSVAYSPATRLQVGPSLPRGIPLPTPVDVMVTGIEVTQGVQEDHCHNCLGYGGGTLPTRAQSNLSAPGQATYEGVTLAQGKTTVVRVYAHVATGTVSCQTAGALTCTAQLELLDAKGNRLASYSPDSWPAQLTPSTCGGVCVGAAERANPGSSFNFEIPATETYQNFITFRVLVTPPASLTQGQQCYQCQGNIFTLYYVPFQPVTTVQIHPIPLTVGGIGPNASPGQVFAGAQTMFPVDLNIWNYDAPAAIDGKTNYNASLVELDRAAEEHLPDGSYPVGVYFSNTPIGTGLGPQPGFSGNTIQVLEHSAPGEPGCPSGSPYFCVGLTSSGSIVPDTVRPITAVAHELGHGLGLYHADTGSGCNQTTGCSGNHPDGSKDCGGNSGNLAANPPVGLQVGESWPTDDEGLLQSIGLDIRNWQPGTPGSLPSTYVDGFDHLGNPSAATHYYDFMSYCPSGVTTNAGYDSLHWISQRNWTRLINYPGYPAAPASYFDPAADRGSRAVAGTPVRVMAVAMPGGATTIAEVTADASINLPPTPGSPYRIEMRDAAGNVLASAVPATARIHVDGVGAPQGLLVAATLPFAPATASVVITADGQQVAQRTRSADPPTGRFLSPRPGAHVGRTRTTAVRWRAHDPDGDRLTSTVEYSPDGGRTWRVLADAVTGDSVRVPSHFLSASRNARIRVRINDGFDSTMIESGRLRAIGAPPIVRIVGAPRGRVLNTAMLLLQAAAYDDTGRPLDGRHVRWYVGKHLIGHGAGIAIRGLKAGPAVIRVVVSDSHGRTGQALTRLRVRAVAARFLFVAAPLRVSAKARSIRIRIAATGSATFVIAHRRYAVGPRIRTITVPILRSRSLLILRCSLRSPGGVIRGTYIAFRPGR